MATKVIVLVSLGFLAASAAVLENDGDSGPLSNNCLKSLYEVVNSYKEDDCKGIRCNPFQISLDQWRTAYNIKVGQGENAFNDCMESHWCSVRTIQDYMSKTLALCVRRTPKTDEYRSVCESALILHTGGPTDCQQASNDGTIKAKRAMLVSSLGRRATKILTEGLPNEDDDGSGQSELTGFGLQDEFAEAVETENELIEEDSIQENFDLNILQLLHENEIDLGTFLKPKRNKNLYIT